MSTPSDNRETITRVAEEWDSALRGLSEEDQRLLQLLRLMGDLIDPRYELKGVRILIGRALSDPEFRARVLDDTDAALGELRDFLPFPEGVTIRCVENTEDHLTILLPLPSESMSERSRNVRDLVFSRTVADRVMLEAAGVDDNDILPIHSDFGLPDSTPSDSTTLGDPSRDG